MVSLIIAEKPDASKKIAEALSDGKVVTKKESGINYFEVTHKEKKILVGCAVGHLFGLTEKDKGKWRYPVFSFEWKPTYATSDAAEYTKKYHHVLQKLCKQADEFIVACDYDIEGSVIGYNCVKFICKKDDAKRMKFSTLTKDELRESYESASPHLDFPQIESGIARHGLDWLWGINLSRALTLSIKNATGNFKILSSGRVQGPALKILAEREREIGAFKPVPFWQLELLTKAINFLHARDKFWKKEEAENIFKKVKGKDAAISNIQKKEFAQDPPHPFDLTALQLEAYKTLGISPKMTLEIAQELYTKAYISYPRTSSNQLSSKINFKKILDLLMEQKDFEKEIQVVLKNKDLKPHNGQKTDPAHPAIHPTGEYLQELQGKQQDLYELIVRRFFACFGEPAMRETIVLEADVRGEKFIAKGTHTTKSGWHDLYGRFLKIEEDQLPPLKLHEQLDVTNIEMHEKETQPPKRYTAASIVKELESRELGTKSTRAEIIDRLYKRDYLKEQSIQVTKLGMKTVETLEKYCPEILDENLSRHFEKEMEQIMNGEKEPEQVIEEAKHVLKEALTHFKKNEKEIGNELYESNKETWRIENTLGLCPLCKDANLMIKKGKYGRFAACESYPECKATFKLPATGMIIPSGHVCKDCDHPIIKIIRKGKRPQEICINLDCPSKKVEITVKEEKCPTCKEGDLVLRKGIYGSFLGCSNYPKCRYIRSLNSK